MRFLAFLQKPNPNRTLRGRGARRGGRFGYRRAGRANMGSYYQQRLAKQKVQQAKYHSIRGTRRRRGRGLRMRGNPSRRSKSRQNHAEPSPNLSAQEPPLRQEQEATLPDVESPSHPKLTPLSIPALEPEVVLMEKAQPTHTPLYVIRPAPITPPPSTFMLEDKSPHIVTHDTWMKVFQYLPQKDLCRCMRVCKTWNRWCCDPSLWKCISIAKMSPIPATALRGIVLRQPRSLDVNWTNISKQHIMWLLARLPGLRALYLQGSSWDAVSALCSSICPPLRFLDLHWVSGIKDSSLKALLSPITNHRPGMVDDQCHLRFLTDLRLTGSDITDTSMATLRDCTPALAKLVLQHCRKITDEGIRILAGATSPIRNTLTGENKSVYV